MTVDVNPLLAGGVSPYGDVILAQSGVASSVTGTTDETVLFSCYVPPALLGPNSRIEIRPSWSFTNSANNKVIAVKVGLSLGAAVTLFTRTRTTVNAESPLIVQQLRGALNSQTRPYSGNSSYATSISAAPETGTIDYSLGQTIYITGDLANSGETITLESVQIKICGSGRA